MPSTLNTWKNARVGAFGVVAEASNKGNPEERTWSTKCLFNFPEKMSPEAKGLIEKTHFPVTHEDLKVSEKNDLPAYACYAVKMHEVINAFPTHFPVDGEDDGIKNIHSIENWYRAYIVLRLYWKFHGPAKESEEGKKKKQLKLALLPPFLQTEDFSDVQTNLEGADDRVTYALGVQARDADIVKLSGLNM